MDLRESTDNRKTYLNCCSQTTPPQNAFRIEFRKSESTLRYEELRSEEAERTGRPYRTGAPDILVAICIHCSNEITITDTEGKMPTAWTATTPTYNRSTGQWRRSHDVSANYPDHMYYDPEGDYIRPQDMREIIERMKQAARGDPDDWWSGRED